MPYATYSLHTIRVYFLYTTIIISILLFLGNYILKPKTKKVLREHINIYYRVLCGFTIFMYLDSILDYTNKLSIIISKHINFDFILDLIPSHMVFGIWATLIVFFPLVLCYLVIIVNKLLSSLFNNIISDN